MKIKTTSTTFSAIIALAIIAVSAFSQNNGLTVAAPDAASGFSTFSAPQNLGAIVNSVDTELLPVPAPSGLSLYFTSNRASGLGLRTFTFRNAPRSRRRGARRKTSARFSIRALWMA